jgi:hypothetical protein
VVIGEKIVVPDGDQNNARGNRVPASAGGATGRSKSRKYGARKLHFPHHKAFFFSVKNAAGNVSWEKHHGDCEFFAREDSWSAFSDDTEKPANALIVEPSPLTEAPFDTSHLPQREEMSRKRAMVLPSQGFG